MGKIVDGLLQAVAPRATAEACTNCGALMGPWYEYRCAFGQWQRRAATEYCSCGLRWGPWRTIGRCFN